MNIFNKFFSNNNFTCAVLCVLALANNVAFADSTCYGTTAKGKIDGAVQLPASGKNYVAYTEEGVSLGRTYVHAAVAKVVSAAYREMEKSLPDGRFVYGETGLKNGGAFPPHRSHQNGLSVDFFVPVRDSKGRSAYLPASADNHYGYDVEFNAEGNFGEYRIDFEAMAAHLYALDQAASKSGIRIGLVIFDLPYLPRLFATTHGSYLKSHLQFMKSKPWVRHDEHYHVDFAVPCKRMT